jgi:uncharacterized MAPEG superfamily protein
MSIAIWCILIAGLMPLAAVAVAKIDKTYDNNNPRDWLARRDGRAKRANAAHLNSFEAFPLFAAGVLVATMLNVKGATIDTLAIIFVVARIGYIWCYISDYATARSLVWFVGMGASIGLFAAAAMK